MLGVAVRGEDDCKGLPYAIPAPLGVRKMTRQGVFRALPEPWALISGYTSTIKLIAAYARITGAVMQKGFKTGVLKPFKQTSARGRGAS